MNAATGQINFIAPDGLHSRVISPGQDGWDEARAAWNLAVDQCPAAVAMPRSAGETAAFVHAAAEQGLRVAAQGTGHGAASMGPLAQTLLVKTSAMRGVTIDAGGRRARAEAGALWVDVSTAAAEHGLAAMAGSAADVGVVGYTLGGGLSWLARSHGLASDHVLSIEVVDAAGRILDVSAAEHGDLFWALRGGGGSFGVVTAIEFELFEIAEVYAGTLLFEPGRARDVLNAYARWTRDAPESVTSLARLLNVPPLPEIPEPLRGRSFVGIELCALGDEAHAREIVAPLVELGPEIDTLAMIPAAALQGLHMDPPGPSPGIGDHAMLGALSEDVVDALVIAAGENSGSPLLSVEMRHLGGALARKPAHAGSLGELGDGFALYGVGIAATPEMAALVDSHLAIVIDAVDRWTVPKRYLNFCERLDQDVRELFEDVNLERLRAIKADRDPQNVFQSNHELGA